MQNPIGNIFVIVAYVGLVCYVAYKIYSYLADKMFILIEKSKLFRILFFAFMSVFFFVTGLISMSDYFAGVTSDSNQYFPLFLGLSVFLMYGAFVAYKDPRQDEQ